MQRAFLSPAANYPYNWLHRIALGWVQSGKVTDAVTLLEWLFEKRASADVANDLGIPYESESDAAIEAG